MTIYNANYSFYLPQFVPLYLTPRYGAQTPPTHTWGSLLVATMDSLVGGQQWGWADILAGRVKGVMVKIICANILSTERNSIYGLKGSSFSEINQVVNGNYKWNSQDDHFLQDPR